MSTITDTICKDHCKLVHYYQKILNANDKDTATRWQNQFICELARHLVAEELVVYPAIETVLGERGRIIVEKGRSEHQAIKEKLKDFQSMEAGSIDFVSSLESLMNDLAQHFNEEQMANLPALDDALCIEDSKSLANSFSRRKAFVPSRSHPMILHKPLFDTVASLIAAPFDYLGNLLRRFPDEKAELPTK